MLKRSKNYLIALLALEEQEPETHEAKFSAHVHKLRMAAFELLMALAADLHNREMDRTFIIEGLIKKLAEGIEEFSHMRFIGMVPDRPYKGDIELATTVVGAGTMKFGVAFRLISNTEVLCYCYIVS